MNRNHAVSRLLVMTLCINLAACTTLRGVPDWQPSATSSPPTTLHGMKPGDRITVTTAGQQSTELVFVALTADALEGEVGKSKQVVQIPRGQIQLVERREFSLAKTAGLVAGAVLLAYAVLVISLHGLAHGIAQLPAY